jgi:hypothetical protein
MARLMLSVAFGGLVMPFNTVVFAVEIYVSVERTKPFIAFATTF